MTVVRVALGASAIALGALALGLAHDVRAWDRALADGDAQFAQTARAARWTPGTWLPGDPAARLTGLEDDVLLREAERAFVVASGAPLGFDNGRRRAQLRVQAELALSEVIATGTPVQASRAGNLTGILAGTPGSGDVVASEQAAAEAFDAAIRADGANTAAKFNLELLLRRIRVVGSREGAGGGSGDLGDALAGAGSGRPGSGY